MPRLSGRVFFGLWFGLALPPITVGALVLTFGYHWALGSATLAILFAWVVVTSRTTCCRCWAYGTAGCGLPSLVAPLFGAKKSAHSISRQRIRLHLLIDWSVAVLLNVWYLWLCPYLSPVVLVWTVGAWMIVVGPKRYHGLVSRLRRPEPVPGRISLPVLTHPRSRRERDE